MDDKKDIGKAFKNKLENLQVSPSDLVWDNIVDGLDNKKNLLPLWLVIARIIGALVIVGGIVLLINNYNKKTHLKPTTTKINKQDTKKKSTSPTVENNDGTNNQKAKIENKETLKNNSSNNYLNTKNNHLVTDRYNDKSKSTINKTLGSHKNKTSSTILKTKKSNHLVDDNTNDTFRISTNSKKDIINNKFNSNVLNTKNSNYLSDNKIKKNKNSNENTNKLVQPNGKINSNNKQLNTQSKISKSQQNKEQLGVQTNPLSDKMNSTVVSKEIAKSIFIHHQLEKVNYLKFTFAVLPKITKKLSQSKKTNAKKKYWSISVNASPIYFGSLKQASFIDTKLDNKSTSCGSTISYGFKISMPISNKINIRTGFNTIDFAYSTKHIQIEDIINNPYITLDNVYFDGIYLFNNLTEELIFNSEDTFNITQKSNYFEIPLEMTYHLIDKKVKIDVIAGLSALILRKNNIEIDNDIKGKINNLNKFSYTVNLGLGFKYNLIKHIDLTIEPIYKLQFNTFSNNVNVKPYYFGIYSGFTYKF